MEKKKAEIIQTIIFAVIVVGQLFLLSRYYSRGDTVGVVIFLVVAVLAGIASTGHFLEWKKIPKQG
ncbi:hypothetical protein KJ972_04785 [Candidatus Micrarchaeota archaeon]|nr:hypothetical protein [Candidatus Micrarchaeota archaeon]